MGKVGTFSVFIKMGELKQKAGGFNMLLILNFMKKLLLPKTIQCRFDFT